MKTSPSSLNKSLSIKAQTMLSEIKDDPSSLPLVSSEIIFTKTTQFLFGNMQIQKIIPKGGYTIYMWVRLTSLPPEKESRHIFQFVKNACFAEITLKIENLRVIVEIGDTNSDKLFSETTLKVGLWYLLSLVIQITPSSTNISLYINGSIDSSTIKQNVDPYQECDLYLGSFKNFPAFKGQLAKAYLLYRPLSKDELTELYKMGYKISDKVSSNTEAEQLKKILHKEFLLETYASRGSIPLEALSPNKIVTDFLENSLNMHFYTEQMIRLLENFNAQNILTLNGFLEKDQILKKKTKVIFDHFNWLLAVTSIMASGVVEKNAKLEIDRFFQAIRLITNNITIEDIFLLGNTLKCIEHGENNSYMISVYEFLNPFYFIFQDPPNLPKPPDPNEEMEKLKQLPPFEETFHVKKGTSKTSSPNLKEDSKITDDVPEVMGGFENEEGEVKSKYDAPLPELKEDWSNGEFEIEITRCCDCSKHFSNRSHNELQFINQFNLIGNEIKNIFPNSIVKGNFEKPQQMGAFDVYIIGVGKEQEMDQNGRSFIYSKAITKQFPSPKTILDKLILLCFTVGDSNLMGQMQKEYMLQHKLSLPKNTGNIHDHPCSLPEGLEKSPKDKEQIEKPDELVCRNWGCGSEYIRGKPAPNECLHHPGRYDFGSRKGLWREGWTCCRGPWKSSGCTKGYHKPVIKSQQVFYCINHGEINKFTGYPDSFCGQTFKANSKDSCEIHTGFFKRAKNQWSCCEAEGLEAAPCGGGSHRNAIYPDEESKIYFFPDPNINPGIFRENKSITEGLFRKYGRMSGYFKTVKEYLDKNSKYEKKEKIQRSLDEKRKKYCLNWGCEQYFLEPENLLKKKCYFHPGRWDFGHNGYKITETMSGISAGKILWKPHWTCCRKDWNTKGCKKGYHNGVVWPENNPEPPRKYKFPDQRLMLYFIKVVNKEWYQRVNDEYILSKDDVIKKYKLFASQKGANGVLGIEFFPELLDRVYLHLLIVSNHMKYQLKYMEVLNGIAEKIVDSGAGNISLDKFLKWWFMDLDEMIKVTQISAPA